jgi:hypothetical protein
MKYRQFAVIFIIFICAPRLIWAMKNIESRIGPFNFFNSPMSETMLVSSFGNGYIKVEKVEGVMLCRHHIYYVPQENLWVDVQLSHVLDKNLERFVEAVLVTKKRLCNEKFKPGNSFGPLTTGQGVKLGDSLEKTISIYGKPSVLIDIGESSLSSILQDQLNPKKGKILRYLSDQEDQLLFSEFYFDENGLNSVLISASE